MIANGPTSACTQVATARRSRAERSSSALAWARARFSASSPPGQTGSWTVGIWGERFCQRAGVGVVAVQMADEARDGGSRGLGRDHRRELDSTQDVFPERGERRAWIGERIDHQRLAVSLKLHSGPAQPSHAHPFLALVAYRTIVRYHDPHMPRRSEAAVAETRSPVTRAAVGPSLGRGARGPHDRRPGRRGGDAKEQRLQPVRQQGGAAARGARGGDRAVQGRGLGARGRSFTRPGALARALRELALLPRARGDARRLLPDHRHHRVRRPPGPPPRRCRRHDAPVACDARAGGSRTAIEAGELPADTDPADLAFELNALAAAASYGFQLSRDRSVFDRARRSMRRALGQPA